MCLKGVTNLSMDLSMDLSMGCRWADVDDRHVDVVDPMKRSGMGHVPKRTLIASWTEYKRFRTGFAHSKIAILIFGNPKILVIL